MFPRLLVLIIIFCAQVHALTVTHDQIMMDSSGCYVLVEGVLEPVHSLAFLNDGTILAEPKLEVLWICRYPDCRALNKMEDTICQVCLRPR